VHKHLALQSHQQRQSNFKVTYMRKVNPKPFEMLQTAGGTIHFPLVMAAMEVN
jgi:hypothetical protein